MAGWSGEASDAPPNSARTATAPAMIPAASKAVRYMLENLLSGEYLILSRGCDMTKRIVLAGLLGGIAMFMWMSLAHVVLPLGEIGVQEIQNEPPVLSAMHASLGEKSGLFVFPATGA